MSKPWCRCGPSGTAIGWASLWSTRRQDPASAIASMARAWRSTSPWLSPVPRTSSMRVPGGAAHWRIETEPRRCACPRHTASRTGRRGGHSLPDDKGQPRDWPRVCGQFQERFRLRHRQNEGHLSQLRHGRQGSRGIAGAEFISHQVAMETINHRDVAGMVELAYPRVSRVPTSSRNCGRTVVSCNSLFPR